MKDFLLKTFQWLIDRVFNIPFLDGYVSEIPVLHTPPNLPEDRLVMIKASCLDPSKHMPYLMGRYRIVVGIIKGLKSLKFVLIGGVEVSVPHDAYLGAMLSKHVDVGENTRDYGDIASRLRSQSEER